jgi:two-component system phosphate regulon sensor histidine kinase PhoR
MGTERTRRERSLTFLLLPAIVISVLVLSGGSFRASFQLDKLREQAVVEASLELANARASLLDQMIIDQDNVVASEVDVSALGEASAKWLTVARRQTPTVRAVLVFDLGSATHEVLLHASRAPGPADDEFRRFLLYRVFGDLALGDVRTELRHLHKTYSGQNYLISYWQREHEGSWYLIVAWHDVARIAHYHLPELYGAKDTQNRVNVVDYDGRIIFGPPLSEGEITVGRQFPTTLYKWRLNVALTAAEQLAKRTERRLLIEIGLAVLSALVVIAGSVVIMNAAARERRLANLKGEFVANVSHELKTPLSLIRMFGELLQSGRASDDQKRKQYVDIIVTESERLSALIENVLDFAKVERGGGQYRFVQGDLGDVVRRAVEVCAGRTEREGVQLELHVAPDLPWTKLDESALETAVTNLIDNALKYAAAGKWIGVEVARPERGALEVIVRDLGEGVPREDRKRIFERFVRREGAQGRGSGIGLALVSNIAQAHGGSAWVVDHEPKGAAFHLRIRIRGQRSLMPPT